MQSPGRFTSRERDPVPIVEEAGWAPGPVWTGGENIAPTRIRSPDRPVRSQLLSRSIYLLYSETELLGIQRCLFLRLYGVEGTCHVWQLGVSQGLLTLEDPNNRRKTWPCVTLPQILCGISPSNSVFPCQLSLYQFPTLVWRSSSKVPYSLSKWQLH